MKPFQIFSRPDGAWYLRINLYYRFNNELDLLRDEYLGRRSAGGTGIIIPADAGEDADEVETIARGVGKDANEIYAEIRSVFGTIEIIAFKLDACLAAECGAAEDEKPLGLCRGHPQQNAWHRCPQCDARVKCTGLIVVGRAVHCHECFEHMERECKTPEVSTSHARNLRLRVG